MPTVYIYLISWYIVSWHRGGDGTVTPKRGKCIVNNNDIGMNPDLLQLEQDKEANVFEDWYVYYNEKMYEQKKNKLF